MNQPDPRVALAPQPFFTTPQQRLALARQRYFEEGVRPSGLVQEPVIQSWSRCVQERRDPKEHVAFNPVTPSRIHSALARSQRLLQAAAGVLSQLEAALAGTECTAILTDPQGVVVHASRSAEHPSHVLLPLARRIGVSLDEEHIGTGAPGVTLRTGQPSRVFGAEHFFAPLQVLHCAAAPIHDIHGRIAAVLDVTCENQPFGFDAAAVVSVYATTIENCLLRAQSSEHLVVHLQTSPALLGTPMEGLVGLAANGRVAWINNVASRLLGTPSSPAELDAQQLFGVPVQELVRLSRAAAARIQRLPNGLTVFMAARLQASDGAAHLHALGQAQAPLAPPTPAAPAAPAGTAAERVAAAPAATLRDVDRSVIERTLQACAGNVSRTARTLGVSRGLVYRHLKRTGES